ncbi:hypothetical protein J3E72DRAFT_170161, partial [Bipolaris maydis]
SDNLDPIGLTYACAAGTVLCPGGVIASAYQNGANALSGNIIFLCPEFFELNDQPTMVSAWNQERFLPSQGFVMLHEVQHLSAIVGEARRCNDECYDISWSVTPICFFGHVLNDCSCLALPDAQKITNAENMAYFAAQILAEPTTGNPTSD